jgi:hypothetical protein
MAHKQDVLIELAGAVEVEVIVGYEKPAGIKVALYGADRRKEKDLGEGVSLDPIPDVFAVASGKDVAKLHKKFVGIFVAISSFAPAATEPVSVISVIRQSGAAVAGGTVVVSDVVTNGGGGVVIVYSIGVRGK